jgi:hypothetical protein
MLVHRFTNDLSRRLLLGRGALVKACPLLLGEV